MTDWHPWTEWDRPTEESEAERDHERIADELEAEHEKGRS